MIEWKKFVIMWELIGTKKGVRRITVVIWVCLTTFIVISIEITCASNSYIREYEAYIRGTFNKLPDFFVQAFKIVVDSSKFSMLLLYLFWDDWPIFMISGLKWTATAGIGIHPTKSWLSQLVNFKNAIWMGGRFRRTISNKIVF